MFTQHLINVSFLIDNNETLYKCHVPTGSVFYTTFPTGKHEVHNYCINNKNHNVR